MIGVLYDSYLVSIPGSFISGLLASQHETRTTLPLNCDMFQSEMKTKILGGSSVVDWFVKSGICILKLRQI